MRADAKAVFDASAALALLCGEPGCEKLGRVKSAPRPQAVIGAINAAEVLAKLVSRGMPPQQANTALGTLNLEIVPFDSELAAWSAEYVRKGVSLGDRCLLAAVAVTGTAGHPIVLCQS